MVVPVIGAPTTQSAQTDTHNLFTRLTNLPDGHLEDRADYQTLTHPYSALVRRQPRVSSARPIIRPVSIITDTGLPAPAMVPAFPF